ncbi:MAG: hypothetical protein ACOC44_20260 [Promethearchaeia archaeon]
MRFQKTYSKWRPDGTVREGEPEVDLGLPKTPLDAPKSKHSKSYKRAYNAYVKNWDKGSDVRTSKRYINNCKPLIDSMFAEYPAQRKRSLKIMTEHNFTKVPYELQAWAICYGVATEFQAPYIDFYFFHEKTDQPRETYNRIVKLAYKYDLVDKPFGNWAVINAYQERLGRRIPFPYQKEIVEKAQKPIQIAAMLALYYQMKWFMELDTAEKKLGYCEKAFYTVYKEIGVNIHERV